MNARISDFGAEADSRQDTALPAYLALSKLREKQGGTLVFAPGEYHFYAEKAFQNVCWISNHDSGLRHIGIPLFDLKDTKVIATGARFIFHGNMIPIWMGACRGITWIGGTIEWEVPLHAEATVRRNLLNGIEIELHPPGSIRVNDGNAYLAGTDSEDELHDFIYYCPNTRRVVEGTQDHFCNDWFAGQYRFEAITGSRFRIHFRDANEVRPPDGARVILQGSKRYCPGFVLDDSHEITIEGLKIRHCGSMGILGQNSGDIRLEKVEVAPAQETGRFLSAGADATHFLNCSGDIVISNCTFQGMLDDATNVHGHYAPIERTLSTTTILLSHGHNQQRGFRIAKAGEQVALVRRDNFQRIQKAKIAGTNRINDTYFILELDVPIAEADCPLAVENIDRIPNLTMQGCHISGNRARGMLIATDGKVLIENNTISSPGAAIAIMPDCDHWFESGPTRDVTIRENRFDNNLSSPGWGDAVIFVSPSIKKHPNAENYFLNESIRIENNCFSLSQSERIVHANSVQSLIFKGNRIKRENANPKDPETNYKISDCGKFITKENKYSSQADKVKSLSRLDT